MRRPLRLAELLTFALVLFTALPPLATAAQEATPADGLPERQVEDLPTADASIRITFLACDDGVDPQQTPELCTTRIYAPDSAYIAIAPDMVTFVNTMAMDADDSYTSPVFHSETITLNDFDHPDFNYFMVEGVDTQERWRPSLMLQPGEHREITVYYWNGPEGLIQPGENTVTITTLGCPEGVDPNVDATACTEPVEAPDSVTVSYGELSGPLNQVPRDENGTYTFSGLPPYTRFSLSTHAPDRTLVTGDAESITDEGAEVYALRGEHRELTVYVYNQDGAVDTGEIRIGFWGCPEGVDPNIDASPCTTLLDAPPEARVVHRHDILNVIVAEQPRADDGTYIIEDVTPEGYPLVGLDHPEYNAFVAEGLTESGMVGNVIAVHPGETTEVHVYYYNE